MFSNWLLHLERVHHINLLSTIRRHWFTNLFKHDKNLWCWNNISRRYTEFGISKLSLSMHNHSNINIFPSIRPQTLKVEKKGNMGFETAAMSRTYHFNPFHSEEMSPDHTISFDLIKGIEGYHFGPCGGGGWTCPLPNFFPGGPFQKL